MGNAPTQNPTVEPTVPPTNPPTQEPTDVTTKSLDENGGEEDDDFYFPPPVCPEDVQLIQTRGVTQFPDDTTSIVHILSQDTSTVTVQLIQVHVGYVDSIYYEYKPDLFDMTCFEETNVALNQQYDTIKIQCNTMSPTAHLQICYVDDISKNFLSLEDDATIPKCCHADNGTDVGVGNKPAVCYTLQINCKTECVDDSIVSRRRLLRGGSK